MRAITVLSGGMGGARFLQGLLHGIQAGTLPGVEADAEVTVVANTADDIWVHGLKVCPDLDTVMYTLGDGIDLDRGWGRRDETWSVKAELAAYGVEPTWFGLGDRDVATHLVRTQLLEAGYPLSQVTEALCKRWLTPVHATGVRLLPMTDDRVETHVAIADADSPSGKRVVHFQEYWVRLRAQVPAETVVFVGLDAGDARPRRPRRDQRRRPGGPAALQPGGLRRHDPRRARHPRRDPRHRRPRGRPVPHRRRHPRPRHGRADARPPSGSRCRRPGSGSTTAHASAGGVLDGWLVDESDADQVGRLTDGGLACRAVPLMMTDHDATAAMAAAAIGLVTG